MTTVVAIQASDGLVIGSDLQRTGTVREFVPKLKLFRPGEIYGFAGIPFYEGVLFRRIKHTFIENPSADYEENLVTALDSFMVYLERKLKTQGLKFDQDMLPQGILAARIEG